MRKRAEGNGVTVQAIAGNHAVFLGFDLAPDARDGCLGFAIHRTDHTDPANVEAYWISGFKTFRSVVPHPDPKAFYTSRDHPIQSFYWGDYSAKPKHHYTYRVVPRYGTPKNLQNRDGVEASVDITTNDPDVGTHGVYFNRGVAASQAYKNKFELPPNKLDEPKRTEAMTWLSRGLVEAMTAFIGQASSPQFAIRAAVYEFTQKDVLSAFGAAKQLGADVQIIYHARGDDAGDANRKSIADEGVDPAMLIERTNAKIAHNKFVVLCSVDASGDLTPISVWTGSTNMSMGGIFGHSNVGHVVRDSQVAADYLAYWDALSGDPTSDEIKKWIGQNNVFKAEDLKAGGTHTLFSPRTGNAPLKWYAERFGGTEDTSHITAAFGLGPLFEEALVTIPEGSLRYVTLEKQDNHQDVWSADHRVFTAVGAEGGPDTLTRWAKERLTGFNKRVHYLHTKVLLLNPLSADPTVVTGSANFSPASTSTNDENMLVIRGDMDIADVYFTEVLRIFNHFYARYWAKRLTETSPDADDRSFLDEDGVWFEPYFRRGNPKCLQREFLMSRVEGNVDSGNP